MVEETDLTFGESFSSATLFLVETDEEALTQLQQGKCFIKGKMNDQAVFVTGDRSFNMRRQDNSNLQYICDHGLVLGQSTSVIKLERIFNPAVNPDFDPSLRSTAQLAHIHFNATASEAEVTAAVAADEGLLLADDRYMRIDTRTRMQFIDQILSVFNLLQATHDGGFSLPEATVILSDTLEGGELTEGAIRALIAPLCKETPANYAKLSNEAVVKVRLQQVLEQDVALALETFLRDWQRLVSVSPISFDDELDETRLTEYGRGLLVIDESLSGKIVKLCDARLLPIGPRERLKCLFAIKKRWSIEELQVYLSPLFPVNENISTFLLKNARVQTKTPQGEKCQIYTSLF